MEQHRSLIGLELEVLARKYDRYGWDRIARTEAGARMVSDWIDALQDYPLDEVQDACRAATQRNPDRMPNEGHIVAEIRRIRAGKVQPVWCGVDAASDPQPRKPISAEERARIAKSLGLPVYRVSDVAKRMGGSDAASD